MLLSDAGSHIMYFSIIWKDGIENLVRGVVLFPVESVSLEISFLYDWMCLIEIISENPVRFVLFPAYLCLFRDVFLYDWLSLIENTSKIISVTDILHK